MRSQVYGEWVVEEDSHSVTGGEWRKEKRVRKLGNTVLLHLITDNRVDRSQREASTPPFTFVIDPDSRVWRWKLKHCIFGKKRSKCPLKT